MDSGHSFAEGYLTRDDVIWTSRRAKDCEFFMVENVKRMPNRRCRLV